MATYRNEYERQADQGWQQQRNAQNYEGSYGAGAEPQVNPADPNAPIVAPAAPPPVQAAPAADPGVAPPWFTNTAGLPPIDTDFSGQAQRGADAAYKGATQFFDQDFTRDRNALQAQLANQGFAVGSEGYNNELNRMERAQNAARENAAFMAQGVGHSQSGDLLMRALQSRAALMGEREGNANRALGARGQDVGRDTAMAGVAASSAAAANNANNARYGIDTNRDLALRGYGITQDQMDFNQLMQLISGARGGVNMPNFGNPQPLDVTGANSIASGNANAAANRSAYDRGAMAQLGAAAMGSLPWNNIWGSIFGP